MADSWGSSTASVTPTNNWDEYSNKVSDWQTNLQGQNARYDTAKMPTAPDVTQPEWGNKQKAVMSDMMSGQRNQLEDYVRRASLTGVQRGGFNVAGAPNYASGLQREAVNSLAAGYDSRYANSLKYMQDLANFEQGQYQNQQQNLGNLWGLQGQALGLQGQDVANQRGYDVSMKQLADKGAEREWQTGERTGTQSWQAGQNAQQQGTQVKLQQMGIDADTAKYLSQQGWQAEQNTQQQGWQAGQNTQQQGWQGTQNTQAQEAVKENLAKQLQSNQWTTNYQGNLARDQWANTNTQNDKQRQLQLDLQRQGYSNDMAKLMSQQQFQTSERVGTQDWTRVENELNRKIQLAIKQGDWGSAMNLQQQAQNYATQQKSSDRAYAEEQAEEQADE
jgi:hypothetical protein